MTEIADMPEYRIEWPDADTITVNTTRMEKPLEVMAYICKSRKLRMGNDNYHIFINSVQGISTIIRLAGLKAGDCRIVCSQSEDAKEKNEKKLPDGFTVQTTVNPVRLFNFYTATCFEGQDISDPNGRTFIVSEGNKDHTKIDISTTLLQICGRIRDSKYGTEINQYYSTSPYRDVSLDEFRASVMEELKAAEEAAAIFNQIPEG